MAHITNFVLKTVEHIFNKFNLELEGRSEECIWEFTQNPQTLLIQTVIHSNNKLLVFTKIESDKKSVIFYKTSVQDLINEESIKSLNIITLCNTPIESLYHILKQVYSPLLTNRNDLYASKLQKNLTDLETNLRVLTYGKGERTNVILSIDDELEYWKTVERNKDASKKDREAATIYSEHFEDVCEEIRTLQSSVSQEARECVENIGGLLDDVWRSNTLPYSQERMVHVLDIVGHIICTDVQRTLSTQNIWKVHGTSKDNDTLALISDHLKVIETWVSACKSLTETYWPNYALHSWSGKPYVPQFCASFLNRMKEIYEIRATYSQVNKLLTNSERQEFKTYELFEPFEDINVWLCNGSNRAWDGAVSRFTSNMRSVEVNIAEKLKPRLHNISTKQMLYEFMRYKTLIQRPLVKQALNNELEIFVSCLMSLLKTIALQVDAEDTDVNMHRPNEMSPIVQRIQSAKYHEDKVKEIYMCAEKYLIEFEGSSELLKLAAQLLKDLKNSYTQLYEEWCRDLQVLIKNGSLQVSGDKPVVEFSSQSQLMVVNFNPKLIRAETELGTLISLSLPNPPGVRELKELAAAGQHARPLQQIASFHNTLGERMIPSTRPMMLQAALDLSSLVKDQKTVFWNDKEQLENYTKQLKDSVFKLESQNSYLTSQHLAIRNIVEKLLETELLAKQSQWKKSLKDIRDIIEKVEANGYKNTELWRSHWDWQIYKVLECQYIKTLLSLQKHFPHAKVDLVLRARKVRVQPPIEEIRVQHYHQLRRLVALPSQFVPLRVAQNLNDTSNIFNSIVEKHSWLGNKAVKQLEETLSSLERTCNDWTHRASLACVHDLEALCKEHLKEPQDWEINFKACKAYGQAVAKITFEDEKIEWLTVGTATLRREFEAQARNLWACLMSTLQSSCQNDATVLDAFIANASLAVESKVMPKNAKELSEISAKQNALQERMPEMEKLIDNLKRKSNLLRTWGGDVSLDGTIREWQKTKEQMISHQQMFEHQSEIVKSSLTGTWENLTTSVDAWLSRWTQSRQRLTEASDATFAQMVDRCRSVYDANEQWQKYLEEKDDLMKECEKFNLTLKASESWQEAANLITEDINQWAILKEYNEEYEAIAEQEWIVFQKKLHLIDELVSKWKGKLEPYTAVTLHLKQELDKYSDITGMLKYLRGADFTERHWREVFSLLEIEYKKPDTLLVKDFLNVSLNIKKHIKLLQKISSTASSESTIRSALNELELWFAGARLNIVYYKDKAQRPVPVGSDYNDVISKIEEQQWVVSSVSGGGGSDACSAWDRRLRAASTALKAAHRTQRRWLYLEPILSNDDGELGMKFRKVDQGFRQISRILEADSRLSTLLQSSRLQPLLDSVSEQLQSCQSALNQYIDEKRTVFPRFYFLSDDDLLELLGQARSGFEGRETVLQTHLKKLFLGCSGVKLGPEGMSITALCSHHGETFQLDHPVDIDCATEVWLKNLEKEMRSSLKSMTLKCVFTTSLQEQDPFALPTQILCLAQNIRFTEQAERAIAAKDLHKLMSNLEKEHLYYKSVDTDGLNELSKKQALILQCSYYMSVVKKLIEKNVASTQDWNWQKQLRFYLLGSKEIIAKMGLAQISYSYEYLGDNTGQFVRTELADECFLILTQALHLGFVGNPFGPAGTGKTETVKALGGLFGRLVLVFNCDEAMDSVCMGRLLTGLALSGAWGCFDEFNRLTSDTLSGVSQQLDSVLTAMRTRTPSIVPFAILNGKQVVVSEWCGIAATMNPVCRGYGGRRELPPAAARVLRKVAMETPKAEQLAEQLLAAKGLPHADILAKDLQLVFSASSALLSNERHYDWGVRGVKAVIGSMREANDEDSRSMLRRVLALNNMSKLTNFDAQRFEKILSLVFGESQDKQYRNDPIVSSLEAAGEILKLVPNPTQIEKCLELNEQLQQRMGVVIVGPPGSGKTTIRRLLKTALQHQGKHIVEYTICPKAMNRKALLGYIDQDTRQWTDGVICAAATQISNQTDDVHSWVVLDGDIDPEWIEALNSVLDDNRLLTLPSGWRIQFGPNVNFIFETDSLEHASPATVSRMGIILLSEESTRYKEWLQCWMQAFEGENAETRQSLNTLQNLIIQVIDWLSSHKSDVLMKVYSINMIKQIVAQFESLTSENDTNTAKTSFEEIMYSAVLQSTEKMLRNGAIEGLHDLLSRSLGPPPTPQIVPSQWITDSLYMCERIYACERTLRAYMNTSSFAHTILISEDSMHSELLAEYVLKETNSTIITVDCTPILEPEDIIEEIKKHGVVRGSSGKLSHFNSNSPVTLFVKTLHRARIDSWGSSPIHNLLMQLINNYCMWTSGGDGSGLQASNIAPTRVVACSNAVPVTPRLACNLLPVYLPDPEDEELLALTKKCLKQNIDKNIEDKDISVLCTKLLALFKEATEIFNNRPHYKWNYSSLLKMCENIKWYSPKTLNDLTIALSFECSTTFKDRLITTDEKSKYNEISKKHLKTDIGTTHLSSKIYKDGVYFEMMEQRDWFGIMEKLINQCVTEHDYNVFGDTGAEVCSELSVLCLAVARATNGGVSVLVGSSGVGRRAAANIVATSLSVSLLFVNHSQDLHVQFKNALSTSSEGNRTLIVLTESAIEDSTLCKIEALCRGQNVFATSKQQNINMDNVKQKLGIIICLNKDQGNLFDVFEKFPWLYSDGHLVWLDGWSNETIRQMPELILQRLIKENISDDLQEHKEAIPINSFISIYSSLEAGVMRAPCRYSNFIKTYCHLLGKKQRSLIQRKNTLTAGVEALRRARLEVAKLQEDAATQEAALSDKQTKANHALDQIGATVRATTDKKEEMEVLKRNIELENEKLQVRKKEIEAELASVEPIIAAARSAVGDIKPEALSEVRSLRAPPDVVRDVLEGVLRLMGIADTSWHSMKNFLSKRAAKEDIRCLDASQISSESIEAVERLLSKRGNSFDPAVAKRASAACAPLAAWVRANLTYAGALQRVTPLQLQQAKLHKNLQEAQSELEALSTGLSTVDERVASLKQQLGQYTRDAAAIEMRLNVAAETIRAATELLEHLATEFDQWEADLEHISREITELNTRSLLASAYIVYLPDVTEMAAREYLKKWSTLIGFDETNFSVIDFLTAPEKQLKWNADGLPSDKSAIKNAVFIDQYLESDKCGFAPLIIDPDGEALSWLRNSLPATMCDFISQHNDKLVTAVQYAARLGRTLIITDVDSIHPAYSSWLNGITSDSQHAANKQRVILVTADASLPQNLPHSQAAYIAVLYFTATLSGLTDQLVQYALQQQNPEVDEKSKAIKLKKISLQKQQHEMQENLLKDLSSNSDILHDANLLASLKKTRATSLTITEALESSKAIESEIQMTSALYEGSAKMSALVVLSVKKLSDKRPLLNLPLDAVMEQFVAAHRGRIMDNVKEKNDDIIRYFLKTIIERIVLSLFKKDKYIVVLHILKQVYEEKIPEQLWQLYLGNYEHIDDLGIANQIKKDHHWLPDDCIKRLSQLKATSEMLYNKLSLNNEQFWKEFFQKGDMSFLSKLQVREFESVVVVWALKPEYLYRTIVAFVDGILGHGPMSSGDTISLAARHSQGRPIALLGAHAVDLLTAHAHNIRITHVQADQGISSLMHGLEEARKGGWLVIQTSTGYNAKDISAFLSSLERESLGDAGDFRVWILSEDSDIPYFVSNCCLNVIIEASEGIKRKALSTISAWGQYTGDVKIVRLHACLALAHALFNERQAYLPQGWSRRYSWEWGEVCACVAILRAHSKGLSIDGARDLCRCIYAAQVGSEPDRRLLDALMKEFMGDRALGHAWTPRGTNTPMPMGNNLQNYMNVFESLPEPDTPDMLALPENCRLAWEKNAANHILKGIKELNTTTMTLRKGVGSATPLKGLLSLWKKLMSGSPLIKGDYSVDKDLQGWWGGVCLCELRQASTTARVIHQTLAKCARANKKQMQFNKVPDDWQLLWPGPESPVDYIRDFCHRANEALRRVEDVIGDGYMAKDVKLNSFLRLPRVLWSLRLHASTAMSVSPSSLRLQAQPVSDIDVTSNSHGLVVRGAKLSGGSWNDRGLCAGSSGTELDLKIYFVQEDHKSPLADSQIEIPLYSSERREEMLMYVRLPLAPGFDRDTATLNAVAMFVAPVA